MPMLNRMPMKYDMAGTMTSDIKIDKETGWVLNAKVNQSINGTVYVKGTSQMTIPMTMNNEMIYSE